MKGATLFSGIGAPECAAPFIDWRWCAEIDPFAAAVCKARFPQVRNMGDVTKVNPDAVEPVDLVVFGSPCQSFSVAGKRLGLDDPRGNLALVALKLVGRLRPRWMVFENVPGLLSSDEGRDFGAFLGLLGECGYGFAYRILDAQHFGVPQRRRRVFVVGYLGDWRPAAAVLFEHESLRGDSAPRREAGERIARPVASSSERGSGYRNDADTADSLIAFDWRAGGDTACGTSLDGFPPTRTTDTIAIAHSLRADGFDASEDGTERGTPIIPIVAAGVTGANGAGISVAGDPMFTLDSTGAQAIAFESRFARNGRGAPSDFVPPLKAQSGQSGKGDAAPLVAFQSSQSGMRVGDQHPTLDGNNGSRRHHGALTGMTVRRLTPTECERLQGFPDDWTAVTYRGKPAADGPRYRALGNSMAVPVLRWILTRLATVAALIDEGERSNTETTEAA